MNMNFVFCKIYLARILLKRLRFITKEFVINNSYFLMSNFVIKLGYFANEAILFCD